MIVLYMEHRLENTGLDHGCLTLIGRVTLLGQHLAEHAETLGHIKNDAFISCCLSDL